MRRLRWLGCAALLATRPAVALQAAPGAEPAPRFAGDAYYAVGGGRLSGTWFDSEGNVHPLHGRAADGALVVEWGAAGATQGRTTYRRLDAVQLDVLDESQAKEGGWREFARIRYQRK